MNPKIALSTCCLSPHYTDGEEMLVKAAELGYKYVELDHGMRLSLVPGALKAVREKVIKVSSCHNFCPLPPEVNHAAPNLYEPTAFDPREREMWLRYTKRTIDFAAEVGADRVVLHGGSARVFWDGPIRRVRKLHRNLDPGELASNKAYVSALDKAQQRVRKKAAKVMPILVHSLKVIAPYVRDHGIMLGLENRDDLRELPLDSEFYSVMSALKQDGVVGYWHDTGHSMVKQSMGVGFQKAMLERMDPFLLGFHLKDALKDGTENLPIGTGDVDWKMLAGFFNDERRITVELSPRVSEEDIVSSRVYLEKLIAEQGGEVSV